MTVLPTQKLRVTLLTFLILLPAGAHQPDEQAVQDVSAEQTVDRKKTLDRLKPLGVVVGEWRGVGQPRRGSRVGAWVEKANCEWQFVDGDAQIVLTSDSEQQFRAVSFAWDSKRDAVTATLRTQASDEPTVLVAQDSSTNDAVNVFLAVGDEDAALQRMTLRRINDIRVTLLFEKRRTATASWRRESEIGYTRAGKRLASSGAGAPQCIVTGGLGTITVMHEGKSYFVCCDGCRQAFDADPDGTIAEYRERLSEDETR